MKPHPRDMVVWALRHPGQVPELSPADWDLLVRQARSAGLLARLACQYEDRGLLGQLPKQAAAHFESAQRVALAQRAEIQREVAHVQRALAHLDVPVILLKGAAYLMADLPAARGRVFSDTDILLPKALLPAAEAALLQNGWATTHHSAYDQRYYREWMHELPPLVHLRRQTALDVHHAIAPETARIRPDSASLLAAACAIPGREGLAMLSAPDMVLHSMLHLQVNDELSHALRDLSDLDLLLRHFGAVRGFWRALVERAQQQGLARVLAYGVAFCAEVLATPIPDEVFAALQPSLPSRRTRAWMFAIWRRALRSPHHSTSDGMKSASLALLYVRAHWLRMPAGLLVKHLTTKALGLGTRAAEEIRANP